MTRRRISDQIQNRSQYRRRHNRNHIRTVLCRTFQSSFFQRTEKSEKSGHGIFGISVRYRVFGGSRPVYRCIFRLGTCACFNVGNSRKRCVVASLLFVGLGIPFVLTALLTDKLKRLFTFIKKHYKIRHYEHSDIVVFRKRQTRKVAYRRPVKRENRKDDKKIFIDTDNSFSINAVSKRRTEYKKISILILLFVSDALKRL